MDLQRVFAAVAVSTPLLVGARPHHTGSRVPDACSLLTQAEVSAAIESQSLPGRQLLPNNPQYCIWSDSPTNSASNRRVTLDVLRPGAYDMGKGGVGAAVTPAPGIGDDAYYQGTGSTGTPSLCVRKGSTDFQVRILNGLKFKPFTLEQAKAKEADLAKSVVAKL